MMLLLFYESFEAASVFLNGLSFIKSCRSYFVEKIPLRLYHMTFHFFLFFLAVFSGIAPLKKGLIELVAS